MAMNESGKDFQRYALTPEEAKSRRARNVALGVAIGLLVLLFYAVTIVKLGPGAAGHLF
jgi:hypothetical protein